MCFFFFFVNWLTPIACASCSWDHLHGNFHMPLAEKPITSCQAMNLSSNSQPGWLLNGCGGSDDSPSTSSSCLCMMAGLTACTVGLGCYGVTVPTMQEIPRWRYRNCCCWTAHKFIPIRDGEGVIFVWSASLFRCRGGIKCCDRQCWVIVALPWWPAVPEWSYLLQPHQCSHD